MINYNLIDRSIEYYKQQGFKRIESPWMVSEEISNLTLPKDKKAFKLQHNKKVLVGSGEQSFMYMIVKGILTPGRYQTTTPCFRDDSFDIFHSKYFIKNELIDFENPSLYTLNQIIESSKQFFISLKPSDAEHFEITLNVQDDSPVYDINYKGVELGSYGIRTIPYYDIPYIFATGLAEPRTSTVLKIK